MSQQVLSLSKDEVRRETCTESVRLESLTLRIKIRYTTPMKKYITIILKVVFSLILLMPILCMTGIFPDPTADMYNTPAAFAFIEMLIAAGYINIIMGVVSLISLIFLWTRRTAAAALLMIPITLNIVSFHALIDGGPFTSGALMGNVFFLINIYFLWQNKEVYKTLLEKRG